jgi:hypothetical protein
MAKALGPARAVAAHAFLSWRAQPSLPHTPPQILHSPRHEEAVLAEEDKERRRGELESRPQASVLATGDVLAPTSSGAPAEGLPDAARARRRAPQAAAQPPVCPT